MILYANIKSDTYLYLPAPLNLRNKHIKYIMELESSKDCLRFKASVDQPGVGKYWTLSFDKKNKQRQHALVKATGLISFMKAASDMKKWIITYDNSTEVLELRRIEHE